MAGLIALGLMIYGILLAITIFLAICSEFWIEYRSYKKRQRIQKIIDKTKYSNSSDYSL